MKSIVAVLFVLLGLVTVQETRADDPHCCMAEQFEVSFGGNAGSVDVASGTVTGVLSFFSGGFDFQRRQYGMDIYQSGSVNETLKLIQFFQTNTQYVIMNSQCYKTEISSQEPNRCVPDAAKCDGSFFLGNSELLVNNWKQDGASVGLTGYIYSTTSYNDCIAGGVSFMGEMNSPSGKVYLMTDGGYLNFTQGIRDPGRWFKVPSICSNSTSKMTDEVWTPLQRWNMFRKTRLFV